MKIESATNNAQAQAVLAVKEKFGSFDRFVRRFTDGQPIINQWKELTQVPAMTRGADLMRKDLKKCGFNFVGSTICYAHMQATGMVNNHLGSCFRHAEVARSIRNTSVSI